MNWQRIDRRSGQHAVVACASLVLIAAGVWLSACSNYLEAASEYEADDHRDGQVEPAKLEPIKGTDVKRVRFSVEGAKRVGLQTAAIRESNQAKIIPYGAVLYDSQGNAFTYTSPEPLTFVRQEIEIERVDGDSVALSDGPPAGTEVVTVGAAEVYGTEFEVAH